MIYQLFISIKGRVRPSLRPSVRPFVPPALFSNIKNRGFLVWKIFQYHEDQWNNEWRRSTVRDSNSWVQGGKPYLLNGFEELKKNLPQYVPRGPQCCLRFSSIFEKNFFFDKKIFFCFFKFFVKLKRGTKVETNLKWSGRALQWFCFFVELCRTIFSQVMSKNRFFENCA